MTTRLCLLPPDVALALPPARVRLLRSRYDGLRDFDENDPLAVAKAISFRELPVRTTELLHSAVYLATDDGRAAIQEAARGRRDLAPWVTLTAVDLAIDVARAADAGDDAAKAVQARARDGFAPRVEYHLVAKRRERPPRVEAILECGREIHAGAFVDGWIVEGRDGVLRAVVVHQRGLGAPVARVGAPPARRHLACDTVSWDPPRGRVGITLARASRLPEWREKLGVACAGDAAFLARRPPYAKKGAAQGEGSEWFLKSPLPRGAQLEGLVAHEVDAEAAAEAEDVEEDEEPESGKRR